MKDVATAGADVLALLVAANEGGAQSALSPGLLDKFKEHMGDTLARRFKGHERKVRDDGKKYLRPSEIGRCYRQVVYDHTVPRPPKEKLAGHTLLKFLYGDLVEALVITLVEAAGHEVTALQGEVEHKLSDTWYLQGSQDCRIDGVVTDVKSASTYGFVKFKQHKLETDDPFGYIMQCSTYALGEDRMAFIAVDKGQGHIVVDEYTPEDEGDILKYARWLVDTIDSGVEPPRPYAAVPDGKSGNMKLPTTCSYCTYKAHCWRDANDGKGLRKFLYSTGPVWLTQVARVPKVVEDTNLTDADDVNEE